MSPFNVFSAFLPFVAPVLFDSCWRSQIIHYVLWPCISAPFRTGFFLGRCYQVPRSPVVLLVSRFCLAPCRAACKVGCCEVCIARLSVVCCSDVSFVLWSRVRDCANAVYLGCLLGRALEPFLMFLTELITRQAISPCRPGHSAYNVSLSCSFLKRLLS